MDKDNFTTIISVNGTSLLEQEQFYKKIVKAYAEIKKISSEEANKLFQITVQDPINGQHMIGQQRGISPLGKECNNCINIDCRKCDKYFADLEREVEKQYE